MIHQSSTETIVHPRSHNGIYRDSPTCLVQPASRILHLWQSSHRAFSPVYFCVVSRSATANRHPNSGFFPTCKCYIKWWATAMIQQWIDKVHEGKYTIPCRCCLWQIHQLYTVTLRYNAVVGRHLLGPPYKRGALWDPVDLFDIIIPRQRTGQVQSVPSSVANA